MGSSAAQVAAAAAVSEAMGGKTSDAFGAVFPAPSGQVMEEEECPTSGELYVIRAGEHQPATEVGHFVRIVSGPHAGYDQAVASLNPPSKTEQVERGGDHSPGAAKTLASVLQTPHADGEANDVASDFQKLMQKLKQQGSGLSPELEEAAVQGLQSGALSAKDIQALLKQVEEEANTNSAAARTEAAGTDTDKELVFLPIDTPVWHLPAKDKHGTALMATRAENVELMRMICGRTDDPMAIVEALRQQQRAQQEEEANRKAEQLRQELLKQQQGTQQLNVLSQLMQLIGSGNSQQSPTHVPPPSQGLTHNNSNLSAILAQALSAGPSHAPAPTSSYQSLDFSAVQRDLEAAMATRSGPCLARPPARGGSHRRNQSVELTSMYQPQLSSPMPSRPQPVFAQPSPPLRANLSPGSAPPGDGPFLVVAADSRVQLTATGFHLPLVSGPHRDFEAALKALSVAAHHRPSHLSKRDTVHISSDSPIWHTTDFPQLAQPLMIIKAASTLSPPPAQREEPPPEPAARPTELQPDLQQQIMENIMAMYQQAQQDQPASAGQTSQLTKLATDLMKSSSASQRAKSNSPRANSELLDAFKGFPSKPQRSTTRSPSPMHHQRPREVTIKREATQPSSIAPETSQQPIQTQSRPEDSCEPTTAKRPAPAGPWFRNKKSHLLGREPAAEAHLEALPVDGGLGADRSSPAKPADEESSDSEDELEIADSQRA